MEPLERDATIICANLLREGYLKKSRVPYLELDERLLQEVQTRLAQTGLELVWNAYSPFYTVRFTHEVQDTIQESNNLGLKNNEIAMLVILWSKLILPKRLVTEEPIPKNKAANLAVGNKGTPATDTLVTASLDATHPPSALTQLTSPETVTPEGGKYPMTQPVIQPVEEQVAVEKLNVKVSELYAEFGTNFGSKTTFRAILGRLNNLQFVRVYDEIITEGIFLDLLVDGYQMGNEIKRSALAFKLAGIEEEEEEEETEEVVWPEENP
jgi:hypothetical protein